MLPKRTKAGSEPVSHRFPVMRGVALPKSRTDSLHALAHPAHHPDLRSGSISLSCSKEMSDERWPAFALSRAMRAAPMAPMRWDLLGRMTSCPQASSKARRIASDLKAPPWTTIRLPRVDNL